MLGAKSKIFQSLVWNQAEYQSMDLICFRTSKFVGSNLLFKEMQYSLIAILCIAFAETVLLFCMYCYRILILNLFQYMFFCEYNIDTKYVNQIISSQK